MAKIVPNKKAAQLKKIVYAKADKHGYTTQGRNENGQFMTALVEDPEVGGVLSEYMENGKIRTYIKDAILNGYTKNKKKEILIGNSPTDTIQKMYSADTNVIQSTKNITVCRSDDGRIFIVSSGTFLKWETALKKALELIACEPKLIVEGKTPEICLRLAVLNKGITDGDKALVTDALKAIGAKARFCGS